MALSSLCIFPATFPVRIGNNLNRRFSRANLQTSSTTTNQSASVHLISDVKTLNSGNHILACPIRYEKMISKDDLVSSVDSTSQSSFQCNTCKKAYVGNETHSDLRIAGGAKEYNETLPASTEFFRLPLVSFIYERGWRQGFLAGGFPGAEKEAMVLNTILYMKCGNIADTSCGSGLFSRLFAKSDLFSQVIALDYSENMLQQCYEFVKQEEDFPKEKLFLVRADIARLPFASISTNAVHAGAALHCWPSPSAAVAVISRILRPGGVFVASTSIMDGPYAAIPFMKPLRHNVGKFTGGNIFLAEDEL